ncbi:MAG: hypothetical protein LBB83_10690 [Treponema sp.]|jgi:hypothetical protein|nr:hypothetical protein [Treponema sp.]
MKKTIFLIMLIGAVIFSSCDNGFTNSGSAPVLKDVFIAGTNSELSGNTETTSFRVGDRAWVRFTVIDEDLDADKILITQKSGLLTVGPLPMSLEAQNEATQYYFGYMDIELAGEWVITAYCLDKKGNKSDTVTKTVTVTE